MASSRTSSEVYVPPQPMDYAGRLGALLQQFLPDYSRLLHEGKVDAMQNMAALRAEQLRPELEDRERRLFAQNLLTAEARSRLLGAQATAYPATEALKKAQAEQAVAHGALYLSRAQRDAASSDAKKAALAEAEGFTIGPGRAPVSEPPAGNGVMLPATRPDGLGYDDGNPFPYQF